jgi:hypothetical protein
MPFGLLDLSIVTDRLLQQLKDCRAASDLWAEEPSAPLGTPDDPEGDGVDVPFNPGTSFDIAFTGLPPDAARNLVEECQVSLYLFHVAPDKFYRATSPRGDRGQPIPEQPLALTLHYLLSAHSKNYIHEQQAMSIALKCFHEHPVVTALVPSDKRSVEFTFTMEPESVDELGRLWQSLSSPLRLSAVYRASAIFLEPAPVPARLTKLALRANVDATPIGNGRHPVLTKVTATPAGLATMVGEHFDVASLEVEVSGVIFPRSANVAAPEPGHFRLVNPRTLEVQFPNGTPTPLKGVYVLRVRLEREQPTTTIQLDVP